jgi:hypothetical protein
MGLFDRLRRSEPPPPEVLRFEMSRTDPDFAHVRDVQHDALNTITAKHTADALRDRFNERLRDSWRHPN